MPTIEPGDVVRVPFPYTDRNTRQHRPALVVSKGGIGEDSALLWVVMITSAENRPWADDLPIADLSAAGLPFPSVVRPVKIATVEKRHVERLGAVSGEECRKVLDSLRRFLG